MRVGSLFSGVDGMALGLEWAGHDISWHSEINPYASSVLTRHWPTVPNLGDITKIDWSAVEPVDIICGGYPCPAFSTAARGRNTAPNLWPWMRLAVAAIKPTFVIIENVAAHVNREFDRTLADLAELGFDAEWEVITACAFGAPHPRRRLFCVAYPHGYGESVRPFHAEASFLPTPSSDCRDGWKASADDVGADHGVPHRMDRLRALGNAVVPQITQWIGGNLPLHPPTGQALSSVLG